MALQISSEMLLTGTPPLLKKGSRGDWVIKLQQILTAKGYSLGKIDGLFGDKTENAIKQFQQDHGLTPDGKVGPKTWAALLDKKWYESWLEAMIRIVKMLNIPWPWEQRPEIPTQPSIPQPPTVPTPPVPQPVAKKPNLLPLLVIGGIIWVTTKKS